MVRTHSRRPPRGEGWIDELRAAAGELTPVVVEPGPDQARFESFLVRVDADSERPERATLVLSPIAGSALPVDVPVRVYPARGEPSWEVRAATVISRGEEAVLEVEPVERQRAGSQLVLPGVPLVLVVPGGLDDRGDYTFPVRRIGRDHCAISASEPLDRGASLPLVEVVGDRRVLRRAQAQVLTSTPYYGADGRPMFQCELSLAEWSASSGRVYDLVSNTAEVRRLMRFAGLTYASGWYEIPGWGRGPCRFEEVAEASARLLLEGTMGAELPATSVRIGVELFTVQYELDVRVVGLAGNVLETALPLVLRRRRSHRRAHHVATAEGERVSVRFQNPIDGSVQERRVRSLSFFGLHFEPAAGDDILWRGVPLEAGELGWRGRAIPLGDLEVLDEPADGSVAVAMRDPALADSADLITLIATMGHPNVTPHEGGDFSALHAMYVKAGLFAPHMHRNLQPIVEQTRDVWERLHRGAADVVRTLVHGETADPDGAVTVMRAWEHAWVAQHFVDVSPQINGATGRLQRAYLDHLLPRPDGRFLVFFIKADNHVMTAYMRRFFRSIGTPEAVSTATVGLWVHDGGTGEAGDAAGGAQAAHVRELDPAERVVVSRAAERCLGADGAAALSMAQGELDLPDTHARFARAGLVRERSCHVVEAGGRLCHALLEERSTPGINLTWMLNATWIVPIHCEPTGSRGGLAAALRHVLSRPAQAPTGERFINAIGAPPADVMEAAGFRLVADVEMFVLNRAGVHRFFQFASQRYGELEARAQRRRARRDSEPV